MFEKSDNRYPICLCSPVCAKELTGELKGDVKVEKVDITAEPTRVALAWARRINKASVVWQTLFSNALVLVVV